MDIPSGARCTRLWLHFMEVLEAARAGSRRSPRLRDYTGRSRVGPWPMLTARPMASCLLLSPGSEACKCGAVVLHATQEGRELHRG